MNKHIRNDEDFENGILKDGHRYRRGSLMMMDSADNPHRRRIVDAAQPGDPYGTNRPGYRIFDVEDATGRSARSAIADARAAYERQLCDAWRGDAASNPTEGSPANEEDDDDDDVTRPRRRRKFQRSVEMDEISLPRPGGSQGCR